MIHLYERHQLLLQWINSNLQGEGKKFLPEPYNWRNYGEMNQEFVEKYQGTSLATAKKLLKESHQQVMSMLRLFKNEELFQKKQFAWIGNTTLGSYFISSTASHYEWGIKKVTRYKKYKVRKFN